LRYCRSSIYPGGEDREGHPVWYDNFNYDFRGLHYSLKQWGRRKREENGRE
jgi:hypothetical protein